MDLYALTNERHVQTSGHTPLMGGGNPVHIFSIIPVHAITVRPVLHRFTRNVHGYPAGCTQYNRFSDYMWSTLPMNKKPGVQNPDLS